MGRAYSMDLRERVLAAHDKGMKAGEVTQRYEVSESWLYKILKRRRETGSIEPLKGKPGPEPKLAEHSKRLLKLVQEQPDATLEELREKLGVPVCLTTVWNALRAMGLTLKKSHPRRGAATA